MKTIEIFKAQATYGEVESVVIQIDRTLPTIHGDLADLDKMTDEQAEKLLEALKGSLPQGVFNRLAGKMMVQVASRFVFPMAQDDIVVRTTIERKAKT